MSRESVFEEVSKERDYQDAKWASYDATNSEEDWLRYIKDYAKGEGIAKKPGRELTFRQRMVKTAALAVAAIEAEDRKATQP